jgi:hypothetical protein
MLKKSSQREYLFVTQQKVTFRIKALRHYNTVIMSECRYDECHYAECCGEKVWGLLLYDTFGNNVFCTFDRKTIVIFFTTFTRTKLLQSYPQLLKA